MSRFKNWLLRKLAQFMDPYVQDFVSEFFSDHFTDWIEAEAYETKGHGYTAIQKNWLIHCAWEEFFK